MSYKLNYNCIKNKIIKQKNKNKRQSYYGGCQKESTEKIKTNNLKYL